MNEAAVACSVFPFPCPLSLVSCLPAIIIVLIFNYINNNKAVENVENH